MTAAQGVPSADSSPQPFPLDDPAKPVAVVWCRQVDNEAESPGYTTIPEEFPNLTETVEAIRTVGHLTVNVADTHDYWDPEPGQPLAYYPNLFLYPACRGQYTCVGRMFLSKEDRPRLGMKTLVLRTQELLRNGGFGASILRWYGSMGGPRRDAGRMVAPDPQLYDLVAEGFFFHRGSTDPVLLVASDRWNATLQVLTELIRSLPSSLVSLTGVLAFPYFLPSIRPEVRDFQSKLPVSITLMRVPRSESAGERHDRRIQGWETTATTVRDLAGPELPSVSGRGSEAIPLVVKYVRDRDEERLAALRERVDLVELPRLAERLADPELQDGRKRRKEAWRIGTAMENAALLLSRPRGRQISVSAETSRRAREYLDAGELKIAGTRVKPGTAADASAPAGASAPAATSPWAGAPPPPEPPAIALARPEAVPVPTRFDPQPRLASRVPSFGPAIPPAVLSLLDEPAIRRIIAEELDRRKAGEPSAPSISPEEIARSIALGVTSAREQLASEFVPRLQRVEERIDLMAGKGRSGLPATGEMAPAQAAAAGPALARVMADVDDRFRRLTVETRATVGAELDRHLRELEGREATARSSMERRIEQGLSTQIKETDQRQGGQLASIESRLAQAEQAIRSGAATRSAELASAVEAQLARMGVDPGADLRGPRGQTALAEAVAELEGRLQQHVEERIARASAAEQERVRELLAKQKPEGRAHAPPTLDPELVDRLVSERVEAAVRASRGGEDELSGLDLWSSVERLRSEQAETSRRFDGLDRRTQVLIDRLVPVVRKAWVKIGELERSPVAAGGSDVGLVHLQQELEAQTRRIDADVQRRINELRHQMETALGHQSRVWLTLIQQLSQLTADRLEPERETPALEGAAEWREPELPPEPSGDAGDPMNPEEGPAPEEDPTPPPARPTGRGRSR